MSTIDKEIAALKAAVDAHSDAQLTEKLGYSHSVISQWRIRGKVPEKAKQRAESYRLLGRDRLEMKDRADKLGSQLVYEGRCLALFLAPSRDAIETRRIALPHYEATWREYATIFDRICLACAEELAERQGKIGGNATDALADLTRDDPADLLARIMARARSPLT